MPQIPVRGSALALKIQVFFFLTCQPQLLTLEEGRKSYSPMCNPIHLQHTSNPSQVPQLQYIMQELSWEVLGCRGTRMETVECMTLDTTSRFKAAVSQPLGQVQVEGEAEASETGKEAGLRYVDPSGFVHWQVRGKIPVLTPHLCELQRHQPGRWDTCGWTKK